MTTTEEQKQTEQMSAGAESQSARNGSSPIWIILLGVVSFAVGFVLVHFMLPQRTAEEPSTAECSPSDAPADAPAEPTAEADAAPDTPAVEEEESENTTDDAQSAEASGGLPEVSPGPTPEGIRLDGAPLYFKCWADDADSSGSKDCDRLRVLEKRMATRLYVVDECKKAHSNESALGLLSLGANLDFSNNTISFWSGPSSTIENASKIGNCVRQKLAGLPLYSVDHRFTKYRVFFSIDFFDPKQREKLLAQKRKRGRQVQVVKDKVNVREEPVDGASLGRISSDSTVTFLKKDESGEWCQVLTPNNREGWMICTALKL